MESDSSDKPRRGRPKKMAAAINDDEMYNDNFFQAYPYQPYSPMIGNVMDGVNNNTVPPKYAPQFHARSVGAPYANNPIDASSTGGIEDMNRPMRKERDKKITDLSEILNFGSSGIEDNMEGEYMDVRPMIGSYTSPMSEARHNNSIDDMYYKSDTYYKNDTPLNSEAETVPRNWEKSFKIDFHSQSENMNGQPPTPTQLCNSQMSAQPGSSQMTSTEDMLFNFLGKEQIATGRNTQWAMPGVSQDDPSRQRQFLNINHLYRLPSNCNMNGLSFGFRKKRRGNQGVSSQWTRGRVSASRFSSLEYIQGGGYGYSTVAPDMLRPEKCLNLPLILNSGVAMTQDSVNVLAAYKKELKMLDMENVTVFQLKMFMKRFGMNYTGKKHEIIEYIKEMYRKMEAVVVNMPKESENIKLTGENPGTYDNVFF